jgi:hypothetical protein
MMMIRVVVDDVKCRRRRRTQWWCSLERRMLAPYIVRLGGGEGMSSPPRAENLLTQDRAGKTARPSGPEAQRPPRRELRQYTDMTLYSTITLQL